MRMLDLGCCSAENVRTRNLMEGDVCCDGTLSSAKGNGVGLPHTRDIRSHNTSIAHADREIGTVWQREARSMTRLEKCQPSRSTLESVRHCARRRSHYSDVAQASPLCSEHAPREVHLWQ